MTPYEMEQHVRGSISMAKSGIQWAGIDERILIPNLVADLQAAFDAGRQSAYEDAASIADAEETKHVDVRNEHREDGNDEEAHLYNASAWAASTISAAIRARAKEVSHADG